MCFLGLPGLLRAGSPCLSFLPSPSLSKCCVTVAQGKSGGQRGAGAAAVVSGRRTRWGRRGREWVSGIGAGFLVRLLEV